LEWRRSQESGLVEKIKKSDVGGGADLAQWTLPDGRPEFKRELGKHLKGSPNQCCQQRLFPLPPVSSNCSIGCCCIDPEPLTQSPVEESVICHFLPSLQSPSLVLRIGWIEIARNRASNSVATTFACRSFLELPYLASSFEPEFRLFSFQHSQS